MKVSMNQDSTEFFEESETEYFNREEIFLKRLQRINETCQKYGLVQKDDGESEILSLQTNYYRKVPKQVQVLDRCRTLFLW